VTRLTSTRNERVKAVAALARRRERRATGRHLVEGPHAVGEALAAGVVETVFVAATHDLPPGDLDVPGGLELPADVEVVGVADHVLAHLADTTTPQGIVAVARDVTVAPEALPADGLLVVLDRLADPGNVGGIVRTADAAGAAGVVCLAGTADVLGPKAVRAAAGSTYHLPLAVEVELDALVDLVRAHGRRLVGLQARAERSVLDLAREAAPLALVLGSEAHGLDPRLEEHLDECVSVPMRGAAESLNVAVAAGIAIYAAAVGMGPAADLSR
jgi:RNA methyltransferase, TrmH family